MSSLVNFAIVAVSGAAGACARYAVSLMLATPSERFPYGTLLANISGALLAGFFATLLLSRGTSSSPLYLLLITGFFGSYTTLSAFSLDTLRLAQDGAMGAVLVNVSVTVGGALLAIVVGAWLATQWLGTFAQ